MQLRYFKFKGLWQASGWMMPACIGVDERGIIRYLSEQVPGEATAMDSVQGLALPGFMNAHSHAFQYAMAGLAETHPARAHDDFWSWREAMYQCALSMDPDQAEAVAAMLYAEMLKHGYTHVAEFHYLHHDKEGKAYADRAEMGARMVAAARKAGIRITLIPVFYQRGNFGQAPQPRQRRFISPTVDEYFRLLEASEKVVKQYDHARLGFSVHSLRAVDLQDIVATFTRGDRNLPFHIHAAEQEKEVSDCLAYCRARPVQWLLDNLEVNDRMNLVHATHLDDDELDRLAVSGARVVLCPSTEGNLGDGIFRMKEYTAKGGRWCVGTDSHIGLNPLEEFRMIDYRQRLTTHARNTFSGDAAAVLVNEAATAGRKAMGVSSEELFAIGQPFDAAVYDARHPLLSSTAPANWLATIVYAGDLSFSHGTIVGGCWVVRDGRHQKMEGLRAAFERAMKQLAIR